MLLEVAVNGARAPGEHPALPMTPDALAEAIRAARGAGAGAAHLHVRGADGRESLAGRDVAATLESVRARLWLASARRQHRRLDRSGPGRAHRGRASMADPAGLRLRQLR